MVALMVANGRVEAARMVGVAVQVHKLAQKEVSKAPAEMAKEAAGLAALILALQDGPSVRSGQEIPEDFFRFRQEPITSSKSISLDPTKFT